MVDLAQNYTDLVTNDSHTSTKQQHHYDEWNKQQSKACINEIWSESVHAIGRRLIENTQ